MNIIDRPWVPYASLLGLVVPTLFLPGDWFGWLVPGEPLFLTALLGALLLMPLMVRSLTVGYAAFESKYPQRPWWVRLGAVGVALGLATPFAVAQGYQFAQEFVPPALTQAFSHHAGLPITLFHAAVTLVVISVVQSARALTGSKPAVSFSFRRWLLFVLFGLSLAVPLFSHFLTAHPAFTLLISAGFFLQLPVIWVSSQVELAAAEERWPLWKWKLRGLAVGVGLIAIPLNDVLERMQHAGRLPAELVGGASFGLTIMTSLVAVVGCLTLADLVVWAMRRSRSVRSRMQALGLVCAGVAVLLTVGKGFGLSVLEVDGAPQETLVVRVLLLGTLCWVLATSMARRLSQSLEQSVEALTAVRSGNLSVALDESGHDEVAAVGRAFNAMVAQLREAEFLEKMNDDLRSRSTALTRTLEALKHAQADLVRSERMASVATLVKGIAHELNNPIGYITGNVAPLRRYCDFLVRVATELSDGRSRTKDELDGLTRLAPGKDLTFVASDLARLTADLAEGARRSRLIIGDLQSLTAASQRGVEQVELHRAVRHTVSLLEPRKGPRVTVETLLESVPTLSARAGQVEQILVNLVDNALRAVGAEGKVRVRVFTDAGTAVLSVADDGCGMAEDVKRQACEPFFTTRAAGDGSGLGLAIVASIVRGHNGTLSIATEPGKGTDVTVRLPLVGDPLLLGDVEPSAANA